MKGFLWLTTQSVVDILEGCWALEEVDFRESGMNRDVRWAVKGRVEDVARIVRQVIANTKE